LRIMPKDILARPKTTSQGIPIKREALSANVRNGSKAVIRLMTGMGGKRSLAVEGAGDAQDRLPKRCPLAGFAVRPDAILVSIGG